MSKELEILRAENESLKKELLSFKEDKAKKFYLKLTNVIDALSDDLDTIATSTPEGSLQRPLKLLTSDGDNKIFERVKVLLLDAETIFKGLKYARENVMPELKVDEDKSEQEQSMSAVDRRVSKKDLKS